MALQAPELAHPIEDEDAKAFANRIAGCGGIYVLSTDDDAQVFRFGKKQDCVGKRIRHHAGDKSKYDNISGDLMPYKPLLAWRLPGWPSYRIEMAELAMFGAVKAQGGSRFHSEAREKYDKSNYRLPAKHNWLEFEARVERELRAIAELGD